MKLFEIACIGWRSRLSIYIWKWIIRVVYSFLFFLVDPTWHYFLTSVDLVSLRSCAINSFNGIKYTLPMYKKFTHRRFFVFQNLSCTGYIFQFPSVEKQVRFIRETKQNLEDLVSEFNIQTVFFWFAFSDWIKRFGYLLFQIYCLHFFTF